MTAAAAHAFDEIATILDDAMRKRAPVARIVDRHPDLTHADAYAIQEKVVARRLGRGGRMVGIKMGLTSRAKMQQVGVNEAIWGRLTSDMSVEEGGAVESDRFIHPRTEPEIAYLLGRDLAGDETPAAIAAAVEAAMPALEIIDSRYRGFKFGPADVIADNTSAAGFVVGAPFGRNIDLSNLGIVLEVDGRPVQTGSSAAILGHPLRALVRAARLAAEAGLPLRAGQVVLAGAATAAHPCQRGTVVQAIFGRNRISVEFG
ncbi:MAG: 4-oxalocrotonate decarboxylase [Brucellaceae bacterium]|nr:4-oxalocrotonate decarboxylase [Brucellaceae bacterium]